MNRESRYVRARRLAGRVRRRLSPRARQLLALQRTIDELRQRMDGEGCCTDRFELQNTRIGMLEREVSRASTQVAAFEVRLEDLRQSAPAPPASGDEARHTTAALVQEVRREHQRVRARISAAARYEERLRQLEETVNRLDEAARSRR